MLQEADHQRITDAIAAAEKTTSGKIHCVLTREISRYREVPLAWASSIALIAPSLALFLSPALLTRFSNGWAGSDVNREVFRAISTYAMCQIVLFLIVAALLAIPALRRIFTPGFLKRHRVHQAAQHHFIAIHHHASETRPHILIYASLDDRKVEIIASESIHRLVGDIAWKEMAAAVSSGMRRGKPDDGFVNAVQIAGAALAKHFPPVPA
jgi:putative membrane protein